MQVPERIQPKGLADYLEVMSKAVFQTGLSWRVVENKWSGIREAFHGFDPNVVADLTEADLDRLTDDVRVIRNRRKLEAVVQNAQAMVEAEEQHGSIQAYLRSHGGYREVVRDLRKRFKFMGEMGAYYFLWVVGEDVPPHEEVFPGSTGH